jgi:hypothetical protein
MKYFYTNKIEKPLTQAICMPLEQENHLNHLDADSFTGMHLNENGLVGDFIQKLTEEIRAFDSLEKKEFLDAVIQRVNKELAFHNSLCTLPDCSVREYFKECSLMVKILSDLTRLN